MYMDLDFAKVSTTADSLLVVVCKHRLVQFDRNYCTRDVGERKPLRNLSLCSTNNRPASPAGTPSTPRRQRCCLMDCSKLLLPGVALLACVGLLTSQQHIHEAAQAAATDIAYVRHEIREEVHGLESWLRHPHSKHHPAAVDDAGPAAWRDLGRDVDLFLKRVERLETKNLEALESQVKQEEKVLRTKEHQDQAQHNTKSRHNAKPGKLVCDGKPMEHEIIYWKDVPGDMQYESPITPHHAEHDQKYLTFEYDAGGWNNVRMGVECVVVFAHATGRTLVAPPAQNLYLLGAPNPHSQKRKLGFNDFFVTDRQHSASMAPSRDRVASTAWSRRWRRRYATPPGRRRRGRERVCTSRKRSPRWRRREVASS